MFLNDAQRKIPCIQNSCDTVTEFKVPALQILKFVFLLLTLDLRYLSSAEYSILLPSLLSEDTFSASLYISIGEPFYV